MLRPVRERTGLGSPPEPYYTNEVDRVQEQCTEAAGRVQGHGPAHVCAAYARPSFRREEGD